MMQVLTIEWAEEEDVVAMWAFPSYDYVKQAWSDSSDHAHYADDSGPLSFCGTDRETCRKAHADQWAGM